MFYADKFMKPFFSITVDGKDFLNEYPMVAAKYAREHLCSFNHYLTQGKSRSGAIVSAITENALSTRNIDSQLLMPLLDFFWRHSPEAEPIKRLLSAMNYTPENLGHVIDQFDQSMNPIIEWADKQYR